jgi:UDP-N-acetylglucosamine 4,6-dehydratase/5-epimerase
MFQRLIQEKAESLPITDARMTRFWITLSQGVNFVLSSLAMMRGGEIFIPKIPSMRVTDLATSMAPDMPHRISGIRPGEKLHEIMITADDARTTLELEDRYVIEPVFSFWSRETYANTGATPVQDDFSYSSDTNTEWLETDELRRIVSEVANK